MEGLRLVAPTDFAHWNKEQLVVKEASSLVSPEQLPRLKPVLGREVPILGAQVMATRDITAKKKDHWDLGIVKNFSFDTISPRILSLEVRSGWWLFGKKRLIPRSRILKITEEGILVLDEMVKIKNTISEKLPKRKVSSTERE
jgi:hypothetical protein